MLLLYKADAKLAHQAGYVLYGNPPRWHQVQTEVPAGDGPAHYHTTSATEAAAVSALKDAHHADTGHDPEAKIEQVQSVAGFLDALTAGKVPGTEQIQAFTALSQADPETAKALLAPVGAAIGVAKFGELIEQVKAATRAAEPKAAAESEAGPKAAPYTGAALQDVQKTRLADANALKLPASNTNAAVVNKKVSKYKDLIRAGDAQALAAASWGSNTYGKKIAKHAAETVAQMQAAQGAGAPKPEPKSTPEPKAEPKSETKGPEPKSETKGPEPKSETKGPEPVAEPGAEPVPEPEPKSEPEAPPAPAPGLGKVAAVQTGFLAALTALKLPASNTNATSVNKKIGKFKDALRALDVSTMEAFSWGSNSYGQKSGKVTSKWLPELKAALGHPGAEAIDTVPPAAGTDGPTEGDTKTLGGVQYQLINGRWHKVSDAAASAAAPLAPKLTLVGKEYQKVAGAWHSSSGFSFPTGGGASLALDILSGETLDLPLAPIGTRKAAVAWMDLHDASPPQLLNALGVLFPPLAGQEGVSLRIAEVTYKVSGGQWVKAGGDAPGAPEEQAQSGSAPTAHPIDAVPEPDWSVFHFSPTLTNKLAVGLATLKAQIKNGDLSGLKGAAKHMSATDKYIVKLPNMASSGAPKVKIFGALAGAKAVYDYVKALQVAALPGAKKGKKASVSPTSTIHGTATPAAPDVPEDIANWTAHPGTQGGYNPGGEYTDDAGQKWYVKFPANEAATRTEVLANALYAAAGAYVPKLKLVTKGGSLGIASKWIDGSKVDKQALLDGSLAGLTEQFATDAWLANYDTVGNNPVSGKGWDNITNHNGKALRVESGGALDRKGAGGTKAFPGTVEDLKTFRDPAKNARTAAVFGQMTEGQIEASVANVAKISDATITSLVDALAPGDQAYKDQLAATLKARRDDMLKQYPGAVPKEGDTKTENGSTYQLLNGRWHRVTPDVAGGFIPHTFCNTKGVDLGWQATGTDAQTGAVTAVDKSGKVWHVAAFADEAAAKRDILHKKFLEMTGASAQRTRLIQAAGHWSVAASNVPEKTADPAVASVIEAWWRGQDPADLGDVREAVKVLALLKDSQIDEMVAKVQGGGPALAQTLKDSRAQYIKHFGVRDPWDAVAVDETQLQVAPDQLGAAIDFFHHPDYNHGQVSSKAHINQNNNADSQALLDFALQGNLTALKDYQYDAVDKASGAPIGKKPIAEHPSKHIQQQWIRYVEMLSGIAHPVVQGLQMPALGDGETAEELSDAAGSFDPLLAPSNVSPEQNVHFFMHAGAVEGALDLAKGINWTWVSAMTQGKTDAFLQGMKTAYAALSSKVTAYVAQVQADGLVNHVWSFNTQPSHYGVPGGKQALAADLYAQSVELEEGTQLWRWLNDTSAGHAMSQKLLACEPGDVLQNTDSMCTSVKEEWGNAPHFGHDIRMRMRCLKGARVTPTMGSGQFVSLEAELTTLPGQRFVVLGVKKGIPGNPGGVALDVLVLPPHAGFVAKLDEYAALGKAIVYAVFTNRRAA
ncbi:hypothetical protein [uncultured Thiodictyon sp.]|uniref:hypothetical protein n=1 Tax=uncultured Thiodictyon sp. TaxID=1846217 RepID=UPI0025EFFABE|nr:hypothetical protein [uncultured Thiodictyon sp.]